MSNILDQPETGDEIARQDREPAFQDHGEKARRQARERAWEKVLDKAWGEVRTQAGVGVSEQTWKQMYEFLGKGSFEQGWEEGIAERRLVGVHDIRTMLTAKYGEFDDLQELAERLADIGFEAAVVRILGAATLGELRD